MIKWLKALFNSEEKDSDICTSENCILKFNINGQLYEHNKDVAKEFGFRIPLEIASRPLIGETLIDKNENLYIIRDIQIKPCSNSCIYIYYLTSSE